MSTAGTVNEVLTKSYGECGRLRFVSATALAFKPFNGKAIKINGVVYDIPAAGMVGLANTSIRVNGVAAQNLAASTTYYVYAFINAGVLTADFSTTGHSTSVAAGNAGVEIKTGDQTRTLVGMIRTNASAQFADTYKARFVISWFNRANINLQGEHTAGYQVSAQSPIQGQANTRAEFCVWGDDAVFLGVHGWFNNSLGYYSRGHLGLDGITATLQIGIDVINYQSNVGPYLSTAMLYHARYIPEGYHFIVPLVWTDGGLSQFWLYAYAMLRG